MRIRIFIIHSFFIIIGPVSTSNLLFAQEADWMPLVREVVVNHDDSLVRAHILVRSIEIEVENQLHYYWYKQHRIFSNMGGYAGDLLHGEYLVFDKDKNLITKGKYVNGLRDGTWKYWNSLGVLRYVIEYKNGLLDGNYIKYDSAGEIENQFTYKKGIKELDRSLKSENDSSKIGIRIWNSSNSSQRENSDINAN